MIELELKHIAPYLPYNIQARDVGNHDKIIKNNAILATVACTYPHAIKPLLRPMSDLFKEIEHQGEKVCVAELIRDSAPNEKHLWGINTKQQTLTNITRERFWMPLKEPLSLPYWAIEILFEYHFDVFGLIENGLAEPIKTK